MIIARGMYIHAIPCKLKLFFEKKNYFQNTISPFTILIEIEIVFSKHDYNILSECIQAVCDKLCVTIFFVCYNFTHTKNIWSL